MHPRAHHHAHTTKKYKRMSQLKISRAYDDFPAMIRPITLNSPTNHDEVTLTHWGYTEFFEQKCIYLDWDAWDCVNEQLRAAVTYYHLLFRLVQSQNQRRAKFWALVL
jgi:hypothetical protein